MIRRVIRGIYRLSAPQRTPRQKHEPRHRPGSKRARTQICLAHSARRRHSPKPPGAFTPSSCPRGLPFGWSKSLLSSREHISCFSTHRPQRGRVQAPRKSAPRSSTESLREGRITPKIISQLRKQFDSTLRQKMLLDTKTATGWVYAAIQEIARRSLVDKVARLSTQDRRDLFSEAASKLGIRPAIIEKDFWVCVVLKTLFLHSPFKDALVFKGDASLEGLRSY